MFEDYSAQEPIAVWSSVRGVWETSQVSMLCGHSVPFLETWPIRGSMRSGRVYERRMLGHLMDGSGFSSSQSGLLRTPTAVEAEGGLVHPEKARAENRTVRLGAQILEMTGDLLPTPDAYAGTRGGSQHPDMKKAGGHQVVLADVVEKSLLPTPVAQPSGNTPEDHLRKKPGRVQVTDLAIIVENDLLESGGKLLPTPLAERFDGRKSQAFATGRATIHDIVENDKWGSYWPAIDRWAKTLGREAPAPTKLSARGNPQLSAAFVEWMMGLPEGWVTELGLSRNEQLRMLGNGVVPQQALRAIELMEGKKQ